MERVSAGAPLLFWLDSFGYMPHPLSIHHYVAFPESERRQERRFNRKGVVMNIHRGIRTMYILTAVVSHFSWLYIQEIEIRSYVISLGDNDFIFSAQKIFVTHLPNTKKENLKNVMFLE
jgi:hypothetical protein